MLVVRMLLGTPFTIAASGTEAGAISQGTCRLACPVETNAKGAANPLIQKLTPFSDVGKGNRTAPALLELRRSPYTLASDPGASTVAELSAAFTAPPSANRGA